MAYAIRKIVVAADAAAPAVAGAAALARRLGASLHLVSGVYDADVAGERFGASAELDAARAALVEARREALEDLARQFRTASALQVTVEACWSRPAVDAVLAQARAAAADLLVIGAGRESHGGLSHAAWQLVSASPCPVLLARGHGGAGYRDILVPVDPTHAHDQPAALDTALVDAARSLGHPDGARLRLLHCYLPPNYLPFRAPGANVPATFHRRASSVEAHRDALQQLARQCGIPEADALLEPGDPREAIPDVALRERADLVVMGAVARGRIRRLLIGSTAEAVLGHLGCDVLAVVPPAPAGGA